MEITCTGCKFKLNVPDHKIPKDKKSSFLCPKCKERLFIDPRNPGQSAPDREPRKPDDDAPGPTPAYDASDRPFDYLDKDAKTALLCLGDNPARTRARKALEQMNFHMEAVEDVRTALTRMKYHLFTIILVDETFDLSHKGAAILIQELKELDMVLRRQIVTVLLSEKLRTQDNMAALHLSVNQIINIKDMESNALELLEKSLKDHEQRYAVFNESLKKAGKA